MGIWDKSYKIKAEACNTQHAVIWYSQQSDGIGTSEMCSFADTAYPHTGTTTVFPVPLEPDIYSQIQLIPTRGRRHNEILVFGIFRFSHDTAYPHTGTDARQKNLPQWFLHQDTAYPHTGTKNSDRIFLSEFFCLSLIKNNRETPHGIYSLPWPRITKQTHHSFTACEIAGQALSIFDKLLHYFSRNVSVFSHLQRTEKTTKRRTKPDKFMGLLYPSAYLIRRRSFCCPKDFVQC